MKKTLIAMAVLAASGASFAQVSITGNAGFAYQKDASGTKANTGFGVPDLNLTFTAAEDIGGGTTATATAGLDLGSSRNAGTARNDFSIVIANPAAGALTLRSIEAGNNAEQFSGVTSLANGVDSTNVGYGSIVGHANVKGVKYATPTFSGFTFEASYSQYEKNTNGSTAALVDPTTNGYQTSTGLTLKYKNGGLAVAYGHSNYNTSVNSGKQDSGKDDIGVSYDAGVAKFGLGWMQTSSSSIPAAAVSPTLIASVMVPAGQFKFGLDYANKQAATSSADDVTFLAYGVSYDLSKSSVVKASFGGFSGITSKTGTAGTAPNNDQQFRIGYWKSF
jgi:predicted porin